MVGLLAPRVFARIAGGALLFSVACGGGSSCGGAPGCDTSPYQFPIDDPARPDAIVQDDVVRVRITQDFLDFVRPQLPVLLESQLPTVGAGFFIDENNILHIPLPDQDVFDIGIAEARLRQAEALVWLDDLGTSIDLRFEAPNQVRLSIDNLRVGIDARIKENFAGTTSSCPVVGDQGPRTAGGQRHAAEVSVSATIDPGIGPAPNYNLDVQTVVGDLGLDDLGIDVVPNEIYCQEPECRDCLLEIGGTCLDPGGRCVECRIFCGLVTDAVLGLSAALIDLIEPLLNDLIEPVIEGLVGDTVNALNGTSAKLEQPLSLAELSGIEALAGGTPIGLLVAPRPGRFPVVDRGTGNGMEITIDAGAEASLADCVVDPGPFTQRAGPVPLPAATDGNGEPYHVFTTFASSYLNQVLDAAHRSGALCLKLSTEEIRALSGGQFTLNASLLSLLAAGLDELADENAPVILEIKPRNAADISLGTGEVIGQDADGNAQFDWLFNLGLEDLGVAFHVLIQDRYVRIFEVSADAFVGMNLTVLPDNRLEVAVGEVRIDDFNETFNELLPNADFAAVLPTLLDIALGAILNEAITFDLDLATIVSDAIGGLPLTLRVNEIFRDGPAEDYVTLTLTFTPAPVQTLSEKVETVAALDREEPGLVETVDEAREATGRVRLRVGEDAPADPERLLEYQVRVDGGLWRAARPARPDRTLLVSDPKLRLPGPHLVEVRARFADDYTSLDPTPAKIPVLVDPFAPTVAAILGPDGIEVTVRDPQTTDPETLGLGARIGDGSWLPVPLVPDGPGVARGLVLYEELRDARRVAFQARDASGNRSAIRSLELRPPETPAAADPAARQSADDGGWGCSSLRRIGRQDRKGHAWWVLATLVACLARVGRLPRKKR